MINFLKLGLIDYSNEVYPKAMTFKEFMGSLIGKSNSDNIAKDVADFLGVEQKTDIIHRLRWLGLFEDRKIKLKKGANLDVMLELMLEKMNYAPGETDLTLVHVEVVAKYKNKVEKTSVTMVKDGIPNGDSAMSLAVGLPAAIGARLVLEGKSSGKWGSNASNYARA